LKICFSSKARINICASGDFKQNTYTNLSKSKIYPNPVNTLSPSVYQWDFKMFDTEQNIIDSPIQKYDTPNSPSLPTTQNTAPASDDTGIV